AEPALRRRLPLDLDRPDVLLEEAGRQLQERRLAAPARSDDPDPRVALDLERHAIECDHVTERLADPIERDAHAGAGSSIRSTVLHADRPLPQTCSSEPGI